METSQEKSVDSQPIVVMVHGLAAHRLVWLFLQWSLRRKGLKSKTWGYRSVFHTIEIHARKLERYLKRLDQDPRWSEIHLVCHSMGGIVARQTLLNFKPQKMGRLVLLAVPNQGSPAAKFLFKYVFPFSRTLSQISDERGSYVRNLEFPDGVETGVVFATVDRVVSRESILPAADTPIASIYSGHNDLLMRPTMARQVYSFLSTGEFQPDRVDERADGN